MNKDLSSMTEYEINIIRNKASDKIVISPSPFLYRFGYRTDVVLSWAPRILMRTPQAFRDMSKLAPPTEVSLRAEADLLQRVSHPNLAAHREPSVHSIVQYLTIKGSALTLGEIIEMRITNGYDIFLPKHILKVAADLASALDYLHTKVQLLHGEVSPYNIVVCGKFDICQLSNFTETAPVDKDGLFDKKKAGRSTYDGLKGRWCAPEVIHGGEISCKVDIFSLGLVLWQMLSLIPPHALPACNCGAEDDIDGPDLRNPYTRNYGTRPEVPKNVPEKLYVNQLTLFYWCTEAAPAKRLNARQLCTAANDMLDHLNCGVWFPHLTLGVPLCLK